MHGKNWTNSKYYDKYKNSTTPEQDILNEWTTDGQIACELGNNLHNWIEQYYLSGRSFNISNTIIATEINYFMKFDTTILGKLVPWAIEMSIFNEEYGVAGTIDALFACSADNYAGNMLVIIDWNRSKHILNENEKGYNRGKGALHEFRNTSYYRYCLQQNCYRYILEREPYNKTIVNCYLVQLHPNFDDYNVITVPKINDEGIKYILGNKKT